VVDSPKILTTNTPR